MSAQLAVAATDADGDKEERGRVLVIAGSREMPGALILAANAALMPVQASSQLPLDQRRKAARHRASRSAGHRIGRDCHGRYRSHRGRAGAWAVAACRCGSHWTGHARRARGV